MHPPGGLLKPNPNQQFFLTDELEHTLKRTLKWSTYEIHEIQWILFTSSAL